MAMVPNRAFNKAKQMIGNATHFAAAAATLGGINYDPSSKHQINHINDRKVNARMNQDAHNSGMNSTRISYGSTKRVRKNDPSVW